MWRRRGGAVLLVAAAAAAVLVVAGLLEGGERKAGLLTVDGVYLGSFRPLSEGEAAPDFPKGAEWLNTAGSTPGAPRGGPLTMRELRREGKVVLLHFWDYTSMHSSMAMPALRRWQERYKGYGVEMIGVHRSRYSFAHRLLHVVRAVDRQGLRHPIVNDEHGDISRAYGNQHTPGMFLIGTDGRIASIEMGLDGMEDMEYQMCLAVSEKHPELWCGNEGEAMRGRKASELSAGGGVGGSFSGLSDSWMAWIRWRMARFACMQKTDELPLGTSWSAASGGASSGTSGLSHLQGYSAEGTVKAYTDLSGVPLAEGKFVLGGSWLSLAQGVVSRPGKLTGMENSHLRVRYHGKGAYALMGVEGAEDAPDSMCATGHHGTAVAGAACLHHTKECRDVAGERGAEGWCETSGGQWGSCGRCGPPVDAVRVWLTLNGEPIKEELRGADVEEDALGRTLVTVREPRIYALVGGVAAGDRALMLLPEAPGVAVHKFSFTAECDYSVPKSLAQRPPMRRDAAPVAAK